jgi:CMP-N-acetylneuraminic acid synthetase
MTNALNDLPLVTVYIANHNYGRFIERAIKSVLNQTMPDFELIIIDDGSTDNSREIIERFAAQKNIVTIFQHNQGLSVTNNIALRAARGKYIMRLDADDFLDAHALQILSGFLDRESDLGLVFPDYYLVDEAGNVIEVIRRHAFNDVSVHDQPAHGACTLIRCDALRAVGGYDETFRCQDGYDLWIRFLGKYQVMNVNLPLFYYRQHGSSLTRDETRILTTRAQILEKHAELQKHPLQALAIVPVRGRHMDPRSQAMRLLGGKPLIDWSIDAALDAARVRDVVVSTPDAEVLDYVASRYGNRVIRIKREANLAMVNSDLDSTLMHAVSAYEQQTQPTDALVELYIESPFRGSKVIDSALEAMILFGTDSIVSVRPETDAFYQHNGHGLVPVRKGINLRLEAEEIYREAGDVRAVRRDYFMQHRKIPGGRIGHVVVDQRASLALLTEWDWKIAESVLAHQIAN